MRFIHGECSAMVCEYLIIYIYCLRLGTLIVAATRFICLFLFRIHHFGFPAWTMLDNIKYRRLMECKFGFDFETIRFWKKKNHKK